MDEARAGDIVLQIDKAMQAGATTYFVKPFSAIALLKELEAVKAGKPSPSKAEVLTLSNKVHEAVAAAEKAGYRLQSMLGEDVRKTTTPERPSGAESMLSETLEPNAPRDSRVEPSATDLTATGDSKTREDSPIESKK